eukprot:352915-Chlamydomonas_euryale.AAC.2
MCRLRREGCIGRGFRAAVVRAESVPVRSSNQLAAVFVCTRTVKRADATLSLTNLSHETEFGMLCPIDQPGAGQQSSFDRIFLHMVLTISEAEAFCLQVR